MSKKCETNKKTLESSALPIKYTWGEGPEDDVARGMVELERA